MHVEFCALTTDLNRPGRVEETKGFLQTKGTKISHNRKSLKPYKGQAIHFHELFIPPLLTHCSIFDKQLLNAIDLGENFYKNSIFLAEIDKNHDFLGHTSMKWILCKILDLTKKNHQMALLV